MSRSINNICVLCTERPATTRDHVPPQGIFPKPKPNDLITVPACAKCNSGASTRDETFKLYLALHVGSVTDPIASAFFDDALKTFHHNKKLQRELGFASVPVKKDGKDTLAILWNSKVHDSIMQRTVRGLYFHHFDECLTPEKAISIQWLNQPDQSLGSSFDGFKTNTIGKNQVIYWYDRDPNQPGRSAWLFEFYGRHWAGAHTG